MTLFALIKGNTTFKEIFIWMTYNDNNDILKQIFSFDALLTQTEILNTIDKQDNRYIAKLKDNQKHLKERAIETIEAFNEPTDILDDEDSYFSENNKRVSRKVEIFQNNSKRVSSEDIATLESRNLSLSLRYAY